MDSDKQKTRIIHKVWKSVPTVEGAGVHLRRAFGFRELPLLDPFLLLDDFRSENPADFLAGFPWHPHRGIETITYVLDGDVEHGDSMGNKGIISAGDIQWMTAGSGIIHQEMPKGNRKGQMFGFQLWANLPAHSKMIKPRYQGIKNNDIPIVKTQDGATIRIICGKLNNVQGPVQDVAANPEYLDVSLPSGKIFSHPVESGHTVFAYVIEGEAYFDCVRLPFSHDATGTNYFDMQSPCACADGTLVLYEKEGSEIKVTTDNSAVRFLLVSGKPLNEPIAWYGPIVMNTQEELRAAFREYQEGTFVKPE
ncbi:MAG: pirin family protein [Gammaproteobacteria bacterium]|nr:pirin family protein [Gammaproteobacteria bacterium]